MGRPENACYEWLRHCLQIGWPEVALGELEAVWWRFHDENGSWVSMEDVNNGR